MPTNGTKKKKPPKHLEKMLFINYKEDQMLQDKLDEIHVESRSREIELDHERLNVKKEWKASRQKKIPVDSLESKSPPSQSPLLPRRKNATHEKPQRLSSHSTPSQSRPQSSNKGDNVNAYLLGEYRRMSEVIPSILLALSKKDEKGKSGAVSKPSAHAHLQQTETPALEPDLYRITKLARAVKTMRQNLAFSQKIDMNRPRMSLSKMFKDIHHNARRDEIDQYTDGTCVLLKRKLDKQRRRESMPNLDQPMGNNQSMHASRLSKIHSAPMIHCGNTENHTPKRHSIATTGISETMDTESQRRKRYSMGDFPVKRQTSLPAPSLDPIEQEEVDDVIEPIKKANMVSEPSIEKRKLNTNAKGGKLLPKRRSVSTTIQPNLRDLKRQNLNLMRTMSRSASNLSSSSENKGQFIGEDELRSRQRVALEWQRYERLQQKVDRFLVTEPKPRTKPVIV